MKIILTAALIFLSGEFIFSQSLVSIAPTGGTAGTTLTAQVTASNLFFVTSSPPGLQSIKLGNSSCNFISGGNVQLLDDDHLNVDFDLPADATNGNYDVRVQTALNPTITYQLPAGFSITGGINRSLGSVTPSLLQAGDTTSTVVQGQNIQNMLDSGGFVIRISSGNEQYTGFNISAIDADHLSVDFAPVPWAANGNYDVLLTSNKGCFNLSQAVQVQGGLPRAIIAVNPVQGNAGTILTAEVTGRYLYFATASPPGVQQVKLANSNCNEIDGSNFNVVDDDHVDVDFDIPLTATNGLYDLLVKVMSGESYSLPAGFSITGGYTRNITAIGPATAIANSVFVAGIGGSNLQSMIDTSTEVKLTGPNNFEISGSNITIINPDSITVEFNIVPYAENGFYDLSITSINAGCYNLVQSVEITGGVMRGITSIQPFQAYKGESLTAQITGQYVYFVTGTSTTGGINSITLHNTYNDNIQGTNITVADSDHVSADFTIPYNVHKGLYDVNVSTVGGLYSLLNGFEVKGTVISGQVYLDVDSDGTRNGVDYNLANRRVRLLPDSSISFTDASGNYYFAVDPGTYSTEFVADTNWLLTSSPTVYNVTVNSTDTAGLDFGINPIVDEYDMLSVLTGMTPRCGVIREYTVTYTNRSTTTTHGVVSLQLDADLSFSSSNPAPDAINGSLLEWDYDTLLVNESRVIHVFILMPAAAGTQLSSVLCVNALDQLSAVITTNCDSLNQTVTCSYDPNDKSVEPEGAGASHAVLKNSDLDYLVRFQNTGNDTAFLVVILDTIDPALDLSTLSVIASSHPVLTTIRPQRIVEFRFDDIRLPDSIADELDSHGFVEYRIHPAAGVTEGTIVSNTAHIYFDFNSGVSTNEVTTTLVSTIGILEIPGAEEGFIIYPDPVKDQSTLQVLNAHVKGFDLMIVNALGQVAETQHVAGGSAIIRKKNLNSGIYFVIIRDPERGTVLKGRFVIE